MHGHCRLSRNGHASQHDPAMVLAKSKKMKSPFDIGLCEKCEQLMPIKHNWGLDWYSLIPHTDKQGKPCYNQVPCHCFHSDKLLQLLEEERQKKG
jgi:hypothetical protein